MNKTFSSEQNSKRKILDADLVSRQFESDLMSQFFEIKSIYPNLTRKRIAEKLGFSFSAVRRYIDQINLSKPYNRIKN